MNGEFLWLSVGIAGFVLILEGTISVLANAITKHDTRGDYIRAIAGCAIFIVALLSLIFHWFGA